MTMHEKTLANSEKLICDKCTLKASMHKMGQTEFVCIFMFLVGLCCKTCLVFSKVLSLAQSHILCALKNNVCGIVIWCALSLAAKNQLLGGSDHWLQHSKWCATSTHHICSGLLRFSYIAQTASTHVHPLVISTYGISWLFLPDILLWYIHTMSHTWYIATKHNEDIFVTVAMLRYLFIRKTLKPECFQYKD